jgi:hypothetical protein
MNLRSRSFKNNVAVVLFSVAASAFAIPTLPLTIKNGVGLDQYPGPP